MQVAAFSLLYVSLPDDLVSAPVASATKPRSGEKRGEIYRARPILHDYRETTCRNTALRSRTYGDAPSRAIAPFCPFPASKSDNQVADGQRYYFCAARMEVELVNLRFTKPLQV